MPIPAGIVNHIPSTILKKSVSSPPLRSPYFVMVGTIEGRKNHSLILGVWQTLLKRHGENCPRLVIIGQRGWKCEAVFALLDKSNRLNNSVIEINNCSDDDLAKWLSFAQALLFPSFAEGYGIPLIESMNLGTPVIASNLSVFHEIADDLPLYLNPSAPHEWEQAIEDYCNSFHADRQRQIQILKGYQPISWEAHFDKIDASILNL